VWHGLTLELRRAHIHLVDTEDKLVWQFNNHGGQYSSKEGYHALIAKEDHHIEWWYKNIWQTKGHEKELFSFV